MGVVIGVPEVVSGPSDCGRIDAVLTSVLWLVDPLIIKWLVDTVLPSRRLHLLGIAVISLLLVYSARFITLVSSLYTSSLTSQRVVFGLRRRLFAKLQRCRADFYERRQVGDLAYHLEQDVDQVVVWAPTLFRIYRESSWAAF